MKTLTIREAVNLIGSEPSTWEGNCFSIASALAPHLGGIAVYGHWLGRINPKGYWKGRAGALFVQHGWVVLPDANGKYTATTETIVDPTRWSFEAKKPYLWRGANDSTYDEGGNRFRMASLRLNELPDDDGVPFYASDALLEHVSGLVGTSDLMKSHLLYLAHLSPEKIGWFWVAELYEAISESGYEAMIPIDNWRMVNRRHGLTSRGGR